MIVNKHLSTLTVDDLNQRYRNSVMEYDGMFLHCDHFPTKNTVLFVVGDKAVEMKFDLNLLNIERLPTGYIEFQGKVLYLCYSDVRQYSRGYQMDGNTFFLSPTMGRGLDTWHEFTECLEIAREDTKTHIPKSKRLNPDLSQQRVNKRVAITKLVNSVKDGWFKIWYRTHHVGYTDLSQIILDNKVMMDDLKEFFPNQTLKVSKEEFMELSKPKSRSAGSSFKWVNNEAIRWQEQMEAALNEVRAGPREDPPEPEMFDDEPREAQF